MLKSSLTRFASSSSANAPKSKKKVNCAVYGCGLSASGALAIPRFVQSTSSSNNEAPVTAKEAKFPKRITYFNTENISKISSGFGFSLFASNKKLYGAGLNNRFQIGGSVINLEDKKGQDYYISAKKINIPIKSDEEILKVSSGRAHSLILTTRGVYGIGENCFGQCGIDPELLQTSVGVGEIPLQLINIESDHPITSIHCSLDTSFAINSIGEVFAFGLNEDGQCCNEKYGIQWKPTKIRGDAENAKIQSISGSTDTIMAISEGGEVFIWGQTEYSQAAESSEDIQLNISRHICKTNVGKVKSAGSTSTSCIVANENGEVFVWGVGVLGFGPNVEKLLRPTKMDQPLFDGRKVHNVYAGNSTMAATNDDGRLFVWGENRFASLGLGHEKRQLFPYQVFLPGDVKDVALGPDHSLFLVR